MDKPTKCKLHDRTQRIDDYVMGKLSDKEAKAFEIHLFGCPECLEELRIQEQMLNLIKEERQALIADYSEEKSLKQKGGMTVAIRNLFATWPKSWIYAGAVVAVLVIAFFSLKLWQKDNAAEMDLANFEVNPYLESVMQQTYQTSDVSISILSPQTGENFDGTILFQWEIKKEGDLFSGPFDLKILNNQEGLIHSERVHGNQLKLERRLTPGLYYWTLEDNGEMLILGKFFVSKPK